MPTAAPNTGGGGGAIGISLYQPTSGTSSNSPAPTLAPTTGTDDSDNNSGGSTIGIGIGIEILGKVDRSPVGFLVRSFSKQKEFSSLDPVGSDSNSSFSRLGDHLASSLLSNRKVSWHGILGMASNTISFG